LTLDCLRADDHVRPDPGQERTNGEDSFGDVTLWCVARRRAADRREHGPIRGPPIDALLPDALKNSNPLGIDRLVNREKTRDGVA